MGWGCRGGGGEGGRGSWDDIRSLSEARRLILKKHFQKEVKIKIENCIHDTNNGRSDAQCSSCC